MRQQGGGVGMGMLLNSCEVHFCEQDLLAISRRHRENLRLSLLNFIRSVLSRQNFLWLFVHKCLQSLSAGFFYLKVFLLLLYNQPGIRSLTKI